MAWQLSYYNAKVAAQVETWPVGIRASFLRIVELKQVHGPDIGMPHTKAMGGSTRKRARRHRQGVLLHAHRRAHRDSARQHKEN